MLIECSECGKQISDKADLCPNCGCPVSKMDYENYCLINDIKYDLTDIINMLPKVGDKDTDVHPLYIGGMIRDRTPLDPSSSQELADIILTTKKIPTEFNGEIDIFKTSQAQISSPKCPTCGSTNIKKISGTSKAVGAVAFGLFSKTAKSQFKCKNCGYKW